MRLLALFAVLSALAAAPLPVRSGSYVLAGTPCADAPFAALLRYDGHGLSGAHDSACASRRLGAGAGIYRVATTCRALGDGTPTRPSTVTARYRVLSTTRFAVLGPAGAASVYRWCGR